MVSSGTGELDWGLLARNWGGNGRTRLIPWGRRLLPGSEYFSYKCHTQNRGTRWIIYHPTETSYSRNGTDYRRPLSTAQGNPAQYGGPRSWQVWSHVRRHHLDLNESVAVFLFQHRTIRQGLVKEFISTCMYSQNLKKQTAASYVRRSKQNQRGLRQPATGQLPDQNSTSTTWFGTTSLLLFESPASAKICRWDGYVTYVENRRKSIALLYKLTVHNFYWTRQICSCVAIDKVDISIGYI